MKSLKVTSSIVCLSIFLALGACKDSSNQQDDSSGAHYSSTFYKGYLNSNEDQNNQLVRSRNEKHTSHISVTSPNVASFDADGFFVLKGNSTNPNRDTADINHDYVLVEVNKVIDDTVNKAEYKPFYYFVRKDFSEKIWLRYGKGEYKVDIYALESVVADLYGDGHIRNFRREKGEDIYGDHSHHHHNHDHSGHDHSAGHSHEEPDTRVEKPPLYSFTVNNVRDEDGRFHYPSQYVQSDSKVIRNKALELTKNLTSTEEKVQALHTFVIDHLSYDEASLRPAERKIQDALTALDSGVAVCEGYTSLMASLTRSIGIKTKVIAGFAGNPGYEKGAHAWVKVLIDGQWKFIDPTMNDDYNYHDLQDILLNELPETHVLHPDNPERPDV